MGSSTTTDWALAHRLDWRNHNACNSARTGLETLRGLRAINWLNGQNRRNLARRAASHWNTNRPISSWAEPDVYRLTASRESPAKAAASGSRCPPPTEAIKV